MRGTFECGNCSKQVSDQSGGHFDSIHGEISPFHGDAYGEECGCYALVLQWDDEETARREAEAAPKYQFVVEHKLQGRWSVFGRFVTLGAAMDEFRWLEKNGYAALLRTAEEGA